VPLSCIVLRKGSLSVGIAPEGGAALTRFDVTIGAKKFDILRRASEHPLRTPAALSASCFPMIPYAGRLREGKFEFERHSIHYPLNALPERHSSHGDGFTRPWALTALERHRAVLDILPASSAPIQYHCTQSIELADDRLDVKLTIRNLESRRIPIGVGLHPYFANRRSATLRAHLPVHWNWDAELMPTYSEPNARMTEFERGVAGAQLPIAAQYCGWDGQAQIEWPAERIQVRVLTRPALEHVVVWAPVGEEFFCFEPINHATDSFNLCKLYPLDMQPTILNPGESLEQAFTFIVSHVQDAPVRSDDAL
jgi:aldose 1-epimerase